MDGDEAERKSGEQCENEHGRNLAAVACEVDAITALRGSRFRPNIRHSELTAGTTAHGGSSHWQPGNSFALTAELGRLQEEKSAPQYRAFDRSTHVHVCALGISVPRQSEQGLAGREAKVMPR